MSFMLYFAIIVGFLIIYHHVIYPVLLRLLAKKPTAQSSQAATDFLAPKILPNIHLILPAFNEADVVAQKIRNIAQLDYPLDKLTVTLIGDGCTDNTMQIARETLKESQCAHLPLEIREFTYNQGKIAVLNQAVNASTADIVALSDISALINSDALRIAAAHFVDPTIAVVNSSYHFAEYSSAGEQAYWQYQSQVKQMESRTGSVIGAHGALYFFRQTLFTTLKADTINDDFILPMQIVEQGYKAVHEPAIVATELECVKPDANNSRRKRIAAGNLQQAVRLRGLLLPSFKGVAFNFLSGKVLRVLMPLCLVLFYLASMVLATQYTLFALLAIGQTLFYAAAVYQHHWLANNDSGKQPQRLIAVIYYFASGYWFSLVGMTEYLLKKQEFRV